MHYVCNPVPRELNVPAIPALLQIVAPVPRPRSTVIVTAVTSADMPYRAVGRLSEDEAAWSAWARCRFVNVVPFHVDVESPAP